MLPVVIGFGCIPGRLFRKRNGREKSYCDGSPFAGAGRTDESTDHGTDESTDAGADKDADAGTDKGTDAGTDKSADRER